MNRSDISIGAKQVLQDLEERDEEALSATLSTLTALDFNGRSLAILRVDFRLFARALQMNTTLVELNLARAQIDEEAVPAFAKMLGENRTLTRVNLSGNYIDDDGAKEVARVVATHPSLTDLDLSDNGIFMRGAQALEAALRRNTVLESLNFSENGIYDEYDNGEDCAVFVVRALKSNRTLKWLDLSKTGGFDQQNKAVGLALQVNQALETLIFRNNVLWEKSLTALGQALRVNAVLRCLDLSGSLRSGSIEPFISGLSENTALEELRLAECRLNRRELDELMEAVAHHPRLRTLDLSKNGLCTSQAGVVIAALNKNPRIQEIDLRHNAIEALPGWEELHELQVVKLGHNPLGPDIGPFIAEWITQASALRELYLDYTGLATADQPEIVAAVEIHPSLQHLDLSDRSITPALKDSLSAAMRMSTSLHTLVLEEPEILVF